MPAFDEITDPTMRLVFYPAIIAFIGIAWWLWTQRVRTKQLIRIMENG
jgi:heme exporter protein C